MASPSWVAAIQRNIALHGELVVGIDPNRVDLPVFFDQSDGGHWIARFTGSALDMTGVTPGS